MKLAPEPKTNPDIAHATVAMLEALGVRAAFGVIGGGIAPFADALGDRVKLVHCRHECGAAFAATECSLASRKPTVVFVTTGPGLLNAFNGLRAAQWEGAHVILVSSVTSPAMRGRWAFQETSPFDDVPWFDFSATPHDAYELLAIKARLRMGLRRPTGFIAHLGLTRSILRASPPAHTDVLDALPIVTSRPVVDDLARTLAASRFVLWLGHGARHASEQVRRFAYRSGARVMCSPRGKGIFPETHPQFLGVTGLGGDEDLPATLATLAPEYTIVLGSRLGEFTSFWNNQLLPSRALVHVDVDDTVFGAAYPHATTLGVQNEIGDFVEALQMAWPVRPSVRPPAMTAQTSLEVRRASSTQRVARAPTGVVRPSALMRAVQNVVVEGTDSIVMTEAGTAFVWGSASLRFDRPRYRVSTGWGSMGQASAGVLGAAMGSGKTAVAILGDGAMLMQSEVSTAVQYDIPAVWIVLNDGGYGMIRQGMQMEGLQPHGTSFTPVDFAMFARSMGALGERVTDENELEGVLFRAVTGNRPFVVDVLVDPNEPAPLAQRIGALMGTGA